MELAVRVWLVLINVRIGDQRSGDQQVAGSWSELPDKGLALLVLRALSSGLSGARADVSVLWASCLIQAQVATFVITQSSPVESGVGPLAIADS